MEAKPPIIELLEINNYVSIIKLGKITFLEIRGSNDFFTLTKVWLLYYALRFTIAKVFSTVRSF